MLTVENGEKKEYDKFVNIGKRLNPKITELTGITDKMLEEQGVGEEEIASDLKKVLTPGTLMVAHNCQFDLFFVYYLLKRHYPSEAYEIVSNVHWLDTLTVLKDRKDYPHKLIDAAIHYGIDKVNFHWAIDDTKMLYKVTLAMKRERDDLREYYDLFGYNPKWGPGERIPFIKYKSQPYHNGGLLPPDEILPRK